VIRSYADQATEDVANGHAPRRIPPDILSRARRKLGQINAAAFLTTFATRRAIGLRRCRPIAPDSIQFASTSSGESAFDGLMAMRSTSRSSTTIEVC
jgi:hypothetical protein